MLLAFSADFASTHNSFTFSLSRLAAKSLQVKWITLEHGRSSKLSQLACWVLHHRHFIKLSISIDRLPSLRIFTSSMILEIVLVCSKHLGVLGTPPFWTDISIYPLSNKKVVTLLARTQSKISPSTLRSEIVLFFSWWNSPLLPANHKKESSSSIPPSVPSTGISWSSHDICRPHMLCF